MARGARARMKSSGSLVANRTIVVYDTTSGTGATQERLATESIPNDSLIMAIDGSFLPEVTADADYFTVELSTSPAFQSRTSGGQGSLMTLQMKYEITTSGATQNGVNKSIAIPGGFFVEGGSSLYIHAIGTNALANRKTFTVYLAEQE